MNQGREPFFKRPPMSETWVYGFLKNGSGLSRDPRSQIQIWNEAFSHEASIMQ